jgi:hypothetical protein
MEKNHYGDTILPVVVVQDIVEGRMVCLTSHTEDVDYGSLVDVAGVKLPTTIAEAARSRYVLAFAQDNRSLPIYQPTPSMPFALRWGWDQAQNVPFNATVLLTHPGVQLDQTVPSGSAAVAFGEGIYTVSSGQYVYAADVEIPGTQLEVAYTNPDEGKLTVLNGGTVVAEVYQYHTDGRLTFKVLH